VFYGENGTLLLWHREDSGEAVRVERLLASRQLQADVGYIKGANLGRLEPALGTRFSKALHIAGDEHRWYAYSNTTSIREIEKFGTPEEHKLPEDEGTGLIWRLSSITRLEERDGGVYAELEAYALSRDIPAAFRLIVNPIVRRVSRDSLAVSLHQTQVAIDAQKAPRTK